MSKHLQALSDAIASGRLSQEALRTAAAYIAAYYQAVAGYGGSDEVMWELNVEGWLRLNGFDKKAAELRGSKK